jgi:hypothetical protein
MSAIMSQAHGRVIQFSQLLLVFRANRELATPRSGVLSGGWRSMAELGWNPESELGKQMWAVVDNQVTIK